MTHPLTNTLGTVLDRTVVPGHSKISYGLRRITWRRMTRDPHALRGKTVVVTASSSGLGGAAAAAMARIGGSVHIVVRNRRKGLDAVTEVRGQVPGAEGAPGASGRRLGRG